MGRLSFVVVSLCSACTVGSGPRDVSADDPLPDDLAVGDIVHLGTIAVVVPEPGMTVQAIADFEDAPPLELTIENPIGGIVRRVEAPISSNPVDLSSLTIPNQCTDGAYNLEGGKWATTMQWYFDSGTTPSGNNVDNVEAAFKDSANAITGAHNGCGIADHVSATNQYMGRTGAGPNMTATATTITCLNPDGKNVVGFGTLPTVDIGRTCIWSGGGYRETDIRLNKARSWFALDVPAGCYKRWAVRAVATHEFGHAFGLAHVSETAHPELTMAPQQGDCTLAPYSLGLGDIKGLEALYP
jgi:hypothetical protein